VGEELSLIKSLKRVIQRLNKQITDTIADRDMLNIEIGNQKKLLSALRNRIYQTRGEMDNFYAKANSSMMMASLGATT
jgi:septal ring factor EnvC (AmiA/AmiB activator)